MSSAWLAAVVAALGLNGAALAAIIRLTVRWTRLEARGLELRKDLGELADRVTWLEHHAYLRRRRDDTDP